MLDKTQLRELITETLIELENQTGGLIKFSRDAVELLMMTAAHESILGTYIKQVEGPALGIFQMEPDTYNDIQNNFIQYRAVLRNLLDHRMAEEIRWDLKLAIVMARVHYYRVPEALPTGVDAQAEYAKKYYNTDLGKATAAKYKEDYLKYAI